MKNKPNYLPKITVPEIDYQLYQRYLPTAFDDTLSLLEKINKIIYTLNEYKVITLEMLDRWNEVYEWVMNDGLNISIVNKLNEWLEEGVFKEIINEEIFGELNDKIDGFEVEFLRIISELKVDIKTLEDELRNNISTLINTIDREYSKMTVSYYSGVDYVLSSLDFQSVLATTVSSIKEGDSSRFPQSMVVDYENNRYYVARQTTGRLNDQRLYEYELNSNKLIRYRDIPTDNWVYIEGLALFHNKHNDICFIIPTKRSGQFGIYNFSTDVLEKTINMEGSFKVGIDNNRKFFICSKHGDYSDNRLNATHNGFILYDLDSVINGSPELIKKIDCSSGDMLFPKSQTVTMINDLIFIGKGEGSVGIQVIDTSGNLIDMISYDRKEILTLIGANANNTTSPIENEGIGWIVINGETKLVSTVLTQGIMAIIQHGDFDGVKLSRSYNVESNSGLSVLEKHSAFRISRASGTPSIDTGVGNGLDLYKEIEELKEPGLYSIYAHLDTKNIPINKNMTGFVYARSKNDQGITRAVVYLMDSSGSTYTNSYDLTYSGSKWLGWSQYGSKGTSLTSGSYFDPLNSPNGSFETNSPTNSPPDFSNSIKQYRITEFGQGRKWIECYIPYNNKFFTRSIHTDGVTTDWIER